MPTDLKFWRHKTDATRLVFKLNCPQNNPPGCSYKVYGNRKDSMAKVSGPTIDGTGEIGFLDINIEYLFYTQAFCEDANVNTEKIPVTLGKIKRINIRSKMIFYRTVYYEYNSLKIYQRKY